MKRNACARVARFANGVPAARQACVSGFTCSAAATTTAPSSGLSALRVQRRRLGMASNTNEEVKFARKEGMDLFLKEVVMNDTEGRVIHLIPAPTFGEDTYWREVLSKVEGADMVIVDEVVGTAEAKAKEAAKELESGLRFRTMPPVSEFQGVEPGYVEVIHTVQEDPLRLHVLLKEPERVEEITDKAVSLLRCRFAGDTEGIRVAILMGPKELEVLYKKLVDRMNCSDLMTNDVKYGNVLSPTVSQRNIIGVLYLQIFRESHYRALGQINPLRILLRLTVIGLLSYYLVKSVTASPQPEPTPFVQYVPAGQYVAQYPPPPQGNYAPQHHQQPQYPPMPPAGAPLQDQPTPSA